ncbi:hypothetical protein [Marinobacter profundi]|uniref:Uncharacterized protein n=1 Tax=Marinobacter profundi TaxID=2666256 RepID=A0A2G1UJ41_9GAMM|nr:hypothetical protein [Marinobacter profundi]PHQ14439.1 hypothetical protein CLH61_14095 [Marinobacter profundi]
MYAIEFEADIRSGMVKIPAEYAHLKDAHARIVVMVRDEALPMVEQSPLDFSDTEIEAFKGKDAVAIQREMRDEW